MYFCVLVVVRNCQPENKNEGTVLFVCLYIVLIKEGLIFCFRYRGNGHSSHSNGNGKGKIETIL